MKSWLLILTLLVPFAAANATIDAFPFDDPAKEERYRQLTEELRCLVCQNQSLADSNAELALDLRRQVYRKVRDGESSEAIVDYMVARYGDFVLYRPPVRPMTWLLWFGPLLLLAIGSVVLIRFVRRRSAEAAAESAELDAGERARLTALLREDDEGRG